MKILFITLSNIGDVVLTLPVLDRLCQEYPEAQFTVMVSQRPKEIFANNSRFIRVIVYDKRAPLRKKIALFLELFREHFDIVVDLRNTFYGAFLPCKRRTRAFLRLPGSIVHRRQRHLHGLKTVIRDYRELQGAVQRQCLTASENDRACVERILKENNIKGSDTLFVIAAGARSHTKRWAEEGFSVLCGLLHSEFKARIILVGDENDAAIAARIAAKCKTGVAIACGRTDITQLALLLEKARLVITNDSAVLHIASYLNRPLVAIFGPSSDKKYGPWSEVSAVVSKEIFCRPCEKAQCRYGTLECMSLIKTVDVLNAAKKVLLAQQRAGAQTLREPFQRILIVRTDRIGDVVLSTPAIRAVRDAYPNAYIAMAVAPYAKEIVEGNPFLDEVIVFDKGGREKGLRGTLRFSSRLKEKKFDAAFILHPTNRVHLVTYLAGIPKRIGYDRKLGFLLTDRIEHRKQFGEKHELEYNLDLLEAMGIEATDKAPFIAIKPEAELWADELFKKESILKSDKLLAIHPGASCPSKIWPRERFAEVADALALKYGFKVLLIAGPRDSAVAQEVLAGLRCPVVNLAGKTSVAHLASVLKRCALFISNDSGPVHIASAVGVPVISIFGRSQKGLGPLRWGPVGKDGYVLHKPMGCIECLAHNCRKDFLCLKAITVSDVLKVADSILAGA